MQVSSSSKWSSSVRPQTRPPTKGGTATTGIGAISEKGLIATFVIKNYIKSSARAHRPDFPTVKALVVVIVDDSDIAVLNSDRGLEYLTVVV